MRHRRKVGLLMAILGFLFTPFPFDLADLAMIALLSPFVGPVWAFLITVLLGIVLMAVGVKLLWK